MAKKEWLKKTDEGLAIILPKDPTLAILTRDPRFRTNCAEIEEKFPEEYKILKDKEKGAGVFGAEWLLNEVTGKKTAYLEFINQCFEFEKEWGIWPAERTIANSPLDPGIMGAVLYRFPARGIVKLYDSSFGAILPIQKNTSWRDIEPLGRLIRKTQINLYGKRQGEKKLEILVSRKGDLPFGIKLAIAIFPGTDVPTIKAHWRQVMEAKKSVFGRTTGEIKQPRKLLDEINTYDQRQFGKKPLHQQAVSIRGYDADSCDKFDYRLDILKTEKKLQKRFAAAYKQIHGEKNCRPKKEDNWETKAILNLCKRTCGKRPEDCSIGLFKCEKIKSLLEDWDRDPKLMGSDILSLSLDQKAVQDFWEEHYSDLN